MMMKRWLNRERKNMKGQNQKVQEEVQKIFATQPTRDYLISLMDEVVRQGIYLTPAQQEGAKFTIQTIRNEIEKGDAVIRKENKPQ